MTISMLGYLLCSILSYGFTFSILQKEFSEIAKEYYYKDICVSLFFSLFGPISLTVLLLLVTFIKDGLKFK